jgi:hypothetical protein
MPAVMGRRLVGFLKFRAAIKALAGRQSQAPSGTFYICCGPHPNDAIYMENLTDFFRQRRIAVETLALPADGQRPELLRCLNGDTIGVIGVNTLLDHSWIHDTNFLDVAARAGVPVIHWVLDHSSTRWPEFTNATAANSRFLFLSSFSEKYFRHYALPDSVTSHTSGNTGVSRHSRLDRLGRRKFVARTYNCIIPLNLRRIGGTLEDAIRRRDDLQAELGKTVDRAIATAFADLDRPIETHLATALAETGLALGNDRFNFCMQIVEEAVQIRRRRWIFSIARHYPVLIQSDDTARPFACGSRADFATDVDMKTTFTRMKQARAVLNASHVNDEIHNRTINGLNAGCANIVEDNLIHRRLFADRKNALFFRYDDDSLKQCLDIVCADPARTYLVAKNGFRMRDREPFRFGGFDNIVALARTPLPAASRHPGDTRPKTI